MQIYEILKVLKQDMFHNCLKSDTMPSIFLDFQDGQLKCL